MVDLLTLPISVHYREKDDVFNGQVVAFGDDRIADLAITDRWLPSPTRVVVVYLWLPVTLL